MLLEVGGHHPAPPVAEGAGWPAHTTAVRSEPHPAPGFPMTMSSILAGLPPPVTIAPPVRVDEFTVLEASREEFDRLPESTRAEFDAGTVYMSPAPLLRHQDVVQNLYRVLFAYAEAHGGYVGVAPIDVYLSPTRTAQPDVLYLAPDRLDRITERGIDGAPTLVAEVLSDSTKGHDLRRKRAWYAEAGVLDYWLLDPEAKTVEVLALTDAGYRTAATAGGAETVGSPSLPGFEAEAAALFHHPAFG